MLVVSGVFGLQFLVLWQIYGGLVATAVDLDMVPLGFDIGIGLVLVFWLYLFFCDFDFEELVAFCTS